MLRPAPHRAGRADFPHPVPHLTGSLKGLSPLIRRSRNDRSLAWSAIQSCFVYVLVELRVSSNVSHRWVCSGDAPLPFSGSRWPRFPAFSGTIRALRLPALACPSAYWFRQPAPQAPAGFVFAMGAPVAVQARRRTGVWIVHAGTPFPALLPTGKSRISQVPWRSNP